MKLLFICIAILALCLMGCGQKPVFYNKIEALARDYIQKDINPDWTITQLNICPDINDEWTGYKKVWVFVQKTKRDPWDDEWTCGHLWFKNDKLVKDKMASHQYSNSIR